MNANPFATRVLAAAMIVGLTGCAARTGPAHLAAQQPSPVAAATHQTSPTRSAGAGAGTAAKHYADARAEWRRGASQTSAMQPRYWSAAATDLAKAGHAGYAAAIAELRQLAGLPDAQQTPAQNAEYHHDIDALNRFFHTPGLYS